jgi:hypothetical protein
MPKHDRNVAVVSRALFLVAVATSCLFGRSADSVKTEFDNYVAGANTCTATSDCIIVTPDCPLGCGSAVRADRQADVEAKARELVAEYKRGGQGCAYDCAGPFVAECAEGRCEAVTAEETARDGGED